MCADEKGEKKKKKPSEKDVPQTATQECRANDYKDQAVSPGPKVV